MKFLKRYHLKHYKFSLIMLVLAISAVGVIAVGSTRKDLQLRQIEGVILGLLVMVVISFMDYKWLLKFYWLMYAANLVLLISVLLFGRTVNNAKRWLYIGSFGFQPSDLTKILLILFFARFLSKHKEDMHTKKWFIPECIGLILPTLILIYKQPNLSNTLCIAALFCMMMFLGGLSYKFIGRVLMVFIPLAAIFAVIVLQPNQPFIKEYQQERILAWLEPEKYATDGAYQQQNSIMAIGAGQLSGNRNSATSVKNGNFILEPQTDFIFAVIGEDFGFVGCCTVIILLLLIIIECILTGLRATDLTGQLICGGVASLIGIQTFINISVATGIFPNTGLSLPFVSAGLTSIVCMYMGIGFVLNVGLQPNKYDKEMIT